MLLSFACISLLFFSQSACCEGVMMVAMVVLRDDRNGGDGNVALLVLP